MLTVFIITSSLTLIALIMCIVNTVSIEDGEFSILITFLFITIITFFLWRNCEVSHVTNEFPISHVERRLDGTTYGYATNSINGEFKNIKIPSGVDILTDEQIKDKVSIEWYDYTKANGKHRYKYRLKY